MMTKGQLHTALHRGGGGSWWQWKDSECCELVDGTGYGNEMG